MVSLSTKSAVALLAATGIAGALHFADPQRAEACGCFAPPDPSVPIVQAGERILFSMEDGIVNASIQIQYAGPAEEFGWILPLPSVPEMELGTDELFTQLTQQTQPVYRMDATYVGDCPFDPNRFGGGGAFPDSAGSSEDGDGDGSPLVLRDSVGPYDYAVLQADSKQPMLDWLAANDFFVPAGTEDVMDPYVRAGGYFLALKLRKGNDAGDIQPVVLKYESDLPMIPIILTSVAANPNMGVQVWVLGESRAIPRNYYHTKINDAAIDWVNFGQNYVDVVTDAVDEAEGHHSFVTEYAGTSGVMVDVLDPAWRFGNTAELAAISDPVEYVNYLNYNGYPIQLQGGFFQPTYSPQVLAILGRHLPVPQALLDDGVEPNDYYWNISYWLGPYREQNPQAFADADLEFDPFVLTQELDERVITPTLAAGELFRKNSYLSRLFTTLSPNEMVKDPVFSFNPDLPEVSNVHSAKITYYCNLVDDPTPTTTPALIETENGFELVYPQGVGDGGEYQAKMPWSHYTEILREEGAAEVVTDNTDLIFAALADERSDGDGGGCAAGGSSSLGGGLLALLGLALMRRRRR